MRIYRLEESVGRGTSCPDNGHSSSSIFRQTTPRWVLPQLTTPIAAFRPFPSTDAFQITCIQSTLTWKWLIIDPNFLLNKH